MIAIIIALLIGFGFWQHRALAEKARTMAEFEMKKLGLQLLSVALVKRRVAVLKHTRLKGALGVHSTYQCEFSSDGETTYHALLHFENTQYVKADIPPHKL